MTDFIESGSEVFEPIDIKEAAKTILSFTTKKKFEECDLFNQILIVVWQLTHENRLQCPHPHTITRCVNEVRGKKTRKGLRGNKSKPVKNEGYSQRRIEDCIGNDRHSKYFESGEDSAAKQGIPSNKETLKGWKLNHFTIISFRETAYLYFCLLKECVEYVGISPENRDKAVEKAIDAFYADVKDQPGVLEEAQKRYQKKLDTLVEQNYLRYDDNGFLISPQPNRQNLETCYLKYLNQNAKKEIEAISKKVSEAGKIPE